MKKTSSTVRSDRSWTEDSRPSIGGVDVVAGWTPSPAKPVHILKSSGAFAAEVLKRVEGSFDAHHAVQAAIAATDGDFYIYGGSLRRVLLHDPREGDLDLIVHDDDDRIVNEFTRLGLEHTLNSNKHHRFLWNKLQIDICSPKNFFDGHNNVESLLRSVDLKINSLALHIASHVVIDPFGILKISGQQDVGINWDLWGKANGDRLNLLAIRLARMLYEYEKLTVSEFDHAQLIKSVVPNLQVTAWKNLVNRFPPGKDTFVDSFKDIITKRIHKHS